MERRNLSISVSPVLVHLLVIIVDKLVVVGLSLVIKVVYLWNVGLYWSLRRRFLATRSPLWLLSFGESLRGIHSVRHSFGRGPSFLIPNGQFLLLSFDLLAITVEFRVHFLQVVSIFISLIHLSIIEWTSSIKRHNFRHLIIRKTLIFTGLLNLTSWNFIKWLFHVVNDFRFLRLHVILCKVFWGSLGIVHILLLVAHIKRYSLCRQRSILGIARILKRVTSWAASDHLEAVIWQVSWSKISASSRVLPWVGAGGKSYALRGPGSSVLFLLSMALGISWRSCTLATTLSWSRNLIHSRRCWHWTAPICIKYNEIIVLWNILFETKVLCTEADQFLTWSIVS